MKTKVLLTTILIGVITLLIVGTFKIVKTIVKINNNLKIEAHLNDPDKFFQDQKVVELCQATERGDIETMDRLIKEGIDINTVGKDGMTPFLWLIKFSKPKDENILKKSFVWFVEHKADPLKVYHWKGNAYYTVFHLTAKSPDIFYLKTLLESGLVKDIDAELPENANPTALLQAELSDRFENFKLLLDYGADVDKKIGEFKRSTLGLCSGNMSWQFAYELLKRGVNFMVEMQDNKPDIVWTIEGLTFRPSVSLNYRGADYREKCVEYLENHGVPKIHPWMPEDEKYIKENGKYQLYINENYDSKTKTVQGEDRWVKFEESSKYKPQKDNGVYVEDVE